MLEAEMKKKTKKTGPTDDEKGSAIVMAASPKNVNNVKMEFKTPTPKMPTTMSTFKPKTQSNMHKHTHTHGLVPSRPIHAKRKDRGVFPCMCVFPYMFVPVYICVS